MPMTVAAGDHQLTTIYHHLSPAMSRMSWKFTSLHRTIQHSAVSYRMNFLCDNSINTSKLETSIMQTIIVTIHNKMSQNT